MAKLKILFGEWLPDQPGLAGNVTDAVNCYPVANGYAPILSEVNYSADAGQDLLVSFAGKFSGETNLFAAGAAAPVSGTRLGDCTSCGCWRRLFFHAF